MVTVPDIMRAAKSGDTDLWLALVLFRCSELEYPDADWVSFYYMAATHKGYKSDICKEQLEKIYFN